MAAATSLRQYRAHMETPLVKITFNDLLERHYKNLEALSKNMLTRSRIEGRSSCQSLSRDSDSYSHVSTTSMIW